MPPKRKASRQLARQTGRSVRNYFSPRNLARAAVGAATSYVADRAYNAASQYAGRTARNVAKRAGFGGARIRGSGFRTKRVRVQDTGEGGHVTYSKYSHYAKTPRFMSYKSIVKTLTQPKYLYGDKAAEVKGDYNVSAIDTVLYLYNAKDIKTLVETADSTSSGAHPTPRRQARVYVENVSGSLTISNATNIVTFVTIYTLRKRNPSSLTADVSHTLTPNVLWDQGTEQIVGDTGSQFARIGMKPNYSHQFRKHWEIVGRNYVTLHSGSIHKHSFYVRVNKVCTFETIDQSATPTDTLPVAGWTYAFMIVGSGQPGTDEVTPSIIGTAITNMLITMNWCYKWRHYAANDESIAVVPATALGTITDMFTIDEGTDKQEIINVGTQAV